MHLGRNISKCIVYGADTMDLIEIGMAFKAARRENRLTQAALARTLGMSRATLSALESGRCDEIGVRKLTALLESVGLELSVAPRRTRPTIDELRAERRNAKERT
jgi:transcriptional regulator with XRE-family HTH domain